MPFFFSYGFTEIGPSLASVPLPNPLANVFPIHAAPNAPRIFVLLAFALFSKVPIADLTLPFIALCTAVAAFKESIKLIAVPASIAEILNLFFALRRGALRLGAMTT
jgi:hypothetical protein